MAAMHWVGLDAALKRNLVISTKPKPMSTTYYEEKGTVYIVGTGRL